MDSPKIIEDNGLIIVLDSSYKSSSYNCKVCDLIIRGLEDVIAINNYGCCSDCEDYFYWPNKERWAEGWRPKKEDILKKLDNY